MKYKDLYTATNGIYAVMKSVNSTLYNTLFGDVESNVLDAFAYFTASEKTLLPYLTADTANTVLTSVFYNFAAAWEKAYKALTADYDVLHPNSVTEKTTGNDVTDVVGNTTDTDSEKAFNSTDFVESGKTAKASDTNNARNYTITKEVTNGVDDAQSKILAELEMRTRYTVLQVVTGDIMKQITLSVYE